MTRRPLIKQLDEDLWTASQLSRFALMPLGLRATLIRLPGHKLWVHSPVALASALKAEVQALGHIEFLLAPNDYHHLYFAQWQKAFPEARCFLSPGLVKKRPDLKHDALLDDDFIAPWDGIIESAPIHGQPRVNETVFLHVPSRTLIVTDLVHHYPGKKGGTGGLMRRVMGTYDRLGPSRLSRLAVRDKAAYRASVEKVLAWDFDRVVMAHGKVVETGAKAKLVEAFRVA